MAVNAYDLCHDNITIRGCIHLAQQDIILLGDIFLVHAVTLDLYHVEFLIEWQVYDLASACAVNAIWIAIDYQTVNFNRPNREWVDSAWPKVPGRDLFGNCE